VERARSGEGPTLIEAKTLRIRGHYEGDRQPYRTDLAAEGPEIPRDPLLLLREHVPADVADALDEQGRTRVEEAFAATLAAPRPDQSIVFEDVWS
jgi:pyruvate dehydrogenase E1 component alpha subunit